MIFFNLTLCFTSQSCIYIRIFHTIIFWVWNLGLRYVNITKNYSTTAMKGFGFRVHYNERLHTGKKEQVEEFASKWEAIATYQAIALFSRMYTLKIKSQHWPFLSPQTKHESCLGEVPPSPSPNKSVSYIKNW